MGRAAPRGWHAARGSDMTGTASRCGLTIAFAGDVGAGVDVGDDHDQPAVAPSRRRTSRIGGGALLPLASVQSCFSSEPHHSVGRARRGCAITACENERVACLRETAAGACERVNSQAQHLSQGSASFFARPAFFPCAAPARLTCASAVPTSIACCGAMSERSAVRLSRACSCWQAAPVNANDDPASAAVASSLLTQLPPASGSPGRPQTLPASPRSTVKFG